MRKDVPDEDTSGGFEPGGWHLRDDASALRPLRLVDSEVMTTGAILATHAPAEGLIPATDR